LVSLGGFDPSGGAGVLLDTAVFRRFGFRPAAVLTALTVQNSRAVREVRPVAPDFVRRQWRALAGDLPIAGIKIGMLGSGPNLEAAAAILRGLAGTPRVIDPVLRSSSGARLLEPAAVSGYLRLVRGRAELITPNIEEAARLVRRPIAAVADMVDAARRIYEVCGIPCLVKGGHLERRAVDILFDGAEVRTFNRPKWRRDVHGTGCLLSAAILAFLARGAALPEACRRAGAWSHRMIGKAVRPGTGRFLFTV
jgi:hydroxymethylpyrimidine/phosphomethylpyrimidine kinase